MPATDFATGVKRVAERTREQVPVPKKLGQHLIERAPERGLRQREEFGVLV